MKCSIFLFTILFVYMHVCATTLVKGNALQALSQGYTPTFPNPSAQILTVSQPITAQALDHTTGTLYFALGNEMAVTMTANTIAPAGPYAISKVMRATGSSTPQCIPIANNTTFFPSSGIGIDFLTLATSQGNTNPNVAIVTQNGTNYLTQPNIIISSSDGSIVQGYSNITSFVPTINQNGPLCTGIVQLAANQKYIFAAARPPSSIDGTPPVTVPGDFGLPGSGIAVIGFNPTNLFPTQIPAQPNDTGIKAARLDPTMPAIVIQGINNNAIPVSVPNMISMYWDESLQRLYCGLQLATSGPGFVDIFTTTTSCNPNCLFTDGGQLCTDLVASLSCLQFVFDHGVLTATICSPACFSLCDIIETTVDGLKTNIDCLMTQSFCNELIVSTTCIIFSTEVTRIVIPRPEVRVMVRVQ